MVYVIPFNYLHVCVLLFQLLIEYDVVSYLFGSFLEIALLSMVLWNSESYVRIYPVQRSLGRPQKPAKRQVVLWDKIVNLRKKARVGIAISSVIRGCFRNPENEIENKEKRETKTRGIRNWWKKKKKSIEKVSEYRSWKISDSLSVCNLCMLESESWASQATQFPLTLIWYL